MDAAVELSELTKTFRARDGSQTTAVDRVALTIPSGHLFGILGPNGAGKTTLLRMLHAYWPPTRGTIRVLGLDPSREGRRLKARLGVVPQENNLDPDFDVRRNLTTYARYFGIPRREARRRADELLAFVGLQDRPRAEIESLSGGMKRRLVLARGLINNPDLLLLDEPTTGLDPQARHHVWEKVRELRKAGKTIILTTHYMEEAEQLCDELVIMDGGRIHVRGTPSELIHAHASREVLELEYAEGAAPDADRLRAALGLEPRQVEVVGRRVYLYSDRAEALLHEAKRQPGVEQALVRRGGLEDVFLRLTGRELRE